MLAHLGEVYTAPSKELVQPQVKGKSTSLLIRRGLRRGLRLAPALYNASWAAFDSPIPRRGLYHALPRP